MKRLDEPVADILSELGEAAVNQDWDRAETELDLLSEEIVEALIERRDDDIRQMAVDVERLYAGQAAALDSGTLSRQAVMTGQMRALAALLTVALRHRRAPDAATLLGDSANSRILEALRDDGRSNRDLAKELGYSEETVARKLPLLRAAGLVASRKCGRAMVNELSKAGREAIGDEGDKTEPREGRRKAGLKSFVAMQANKTGSGIPRERLLIRKRLVEGG